MRERTGPRLIRSALAALCALALCACPTYDDDLSDRYVEIREPGSTEEALYVVDFFRFGGFSNAVVRRFRVPLDADPNDLADADPLWCDWTDLSPSPDGPSGDWSSEMTSTSVERPSLAINARFGDDRATIRLGDSLEPERSFARAGAAQNRCNIINFFSVQANFDLGPERSPNALADGAAPMSLPVFTIAWSALVPNEDNPTRESVLLADQRPSTFKYLGDEFVADGRRGLRSATRPLPVLGPKNPGVLIETGRTRIALGHFVVIDDSCPGGREACEPPSRFAWNPGAEPIVASSLECGRPTSDLAPAGTVGVGKAILFVEGSLNELGEDVRARLGNVDAYAERFDRENFYVVLVAFDALGNVITMSLEPDPTTLISPLYREIKLRMLPEDRGCLRNELPLFSTLRS